MEIYEIINKWKINKHLLASEMKMLKGTFNNKLNPNHAASFSESEFIRLKRILISMRTDLEEVQIEFKEKS